MNTTLVIPGVAALLLMASVSSYAGKYIIEDLGVIPATANKTVSINENGDYAMVTKDAAGNENAVIISNGQSQVINSLGYGNVGINALNNTHQATGAALASADGINFTRSALYYADGISQNIQTLDVSTSDGYDINNQNDIVGRLALHSVTGFISIMQAFIYKPSTGQMVLLNDLAPVGTSSGNWELTSAYGISDNGFIAGTAQVPGSADDIPAGGLLGLSKQRAYLFDGSNLTNLLTLGGDASAAYAVNNLGHVAGISDLVLTNLWDIPDTPHVFIYNGTKMLDLGTLKNKEDEGTPVVTAMNDSDVIVGSVYLAENGVVKERAFVINGRKISDLNKSLPVDSGWTMLNRATDINNSGVIVGYGSKDGEFHGFKLTPMNAR